jgi:two-component sensor histidine kinase
VSTDITERKRAEEQVAAALAEKEVLLKEIHHRVKNNLQVISSLLRMQSAGVDDPQVRELFADSQRRVRAMALIHEQLYQSPNLAQINLRDYIGKLVSYLRHSYTQTISKVEIRINVEDMIVEIDRAMPLGLLVSELVSNSLKYAFPNANGLQTGQVWVNIERSKNGLTLAVGDNGVGLPDGLDIKHVPSMGLQLVDSFVSQLQGQLTIQRKPGTVFTIFIPARIT